MDLFVAVVLGVIQGLTEYLPVSSSAHLAIAPWLMGVDPPSFAFDILVQNGTLLAVVAYLREDLKKIFIGTFKALRQGAPLNNPDARLGWMIVVATIPAVIIGLAFKKQVEKAFGDPREVLIELAVTGLLLAAAETLARRRFTAEHGRSIGWLDSVLIGVGQAVAILPGVSRSGATIAAAMGVGVSRMEAGRFSFLMSIPVMVGAGILGLKDLLEQPEVIQKEGVGIAVAFVVAAVVGFGCIRWFLGFLRTHSLYWFSAYCLIVAGVLFPFAPSSFGG